MFIRDVSGHLLRQAKYAALVKSNPRIYQYEGVRIPLRATPELQRIRRNVYRGTHERPEMESIRHLLRPDDVVLELGAGCGIVTAFIAQRLSDSRNLHAVEANPALLKTIECVLAENGVTPDIINAAVGERDGKAEFFFAEDFLSSSTHDRGQSVAKTMVKVVSFAGLLERFRPTFIVFDIEGAEQEIFDVPLPEYVRVLCGELHPHAIGDGATSRVIRAFLNQGFDFLVDRCQGRAVAFARPK